MSSQIKIIPIERPFLIDLAHYVIEKFKSDLPDLSQILVVLPNQRGKLYFRRHLIEASQRPALIPPSMRTIDELLDDIYEYRGGRRGTRLQGLERNFILKQVIDDLKVDFWHELPFLKFVGIGDRLLHFFNELAKERVTLEEVAARNETEHYPERFVANELEIYRKIHERYRRRLQELGVQDEIDRCDQLDTAFDPGCLATYKHVILAGLAATTRIENRVLGKILANAPAELVLHSGRGQDLAGEADLGNPYYPHQKIIQSLGVKAEGLETIRYGVTPPLPAIRIRGLPTESQQTIYLRSVLAEAGRRWEPHRIAVVLADESMAHTVTEVLDGLGLEYNLSLGYPFPRGLPYSLLRLLAASLASHHHYRDFFRLINHPFIKTGQGPLGTPLRPLVYDLQTFMIDNRMNHFEPAAIPPGRFDPLLATLSRQIEAVEQYQPLPEYAAGLAEMINALLAGNDLMLDRHGPEISEFFEHLANLSRLRLPEGSPEPGRPTLEFILAALEHAVYRHQGDPMRGIQVIGYLEARNLDFDCLIIPHLNEGVFPARSDKDLFLNHGLRQRLGLPFGKERDNLSLYYFTELVSGKRELHLTYLAANDQDVRSRFLELIMEERSLTADERPLVLTRTAVPSHQPAGIKDKAALDLLEDKIRRDGLSPTALKEYKICPYQFYLKYICGIREPETIIEEPDAAVWGKAIHLALERFYRDEYPHGFNERDLERAKLVLATGLETALRETLARRIRGAVYIELPIYQRRLERFLEQELERFKAGFRIDARKQEKWINYHITVAGRRIRLKGSIDRVDYLGEKQYIIDYKSGRKPRSREYLIGDDFREFQLPFYALCLTEGHYERIAGLAFYAIGSEIELLDIGSETDLATYLRDFEERMLKPTVAEILDPQRSFAASGDKAACRYCAFTPLCGRDKCGP